MTVSRQNTLLMFYNLQQINPMTKIKLLFYYVSGYEVSQNRSIIKTTRHHFTYTYKFPAQRAS